MPLTVVAILLLIGVVAVSLSKQIKSSATQSISKAIPSSISTAQTPTTSIQTTRSNTISGVWEFQTEPKKHSESMTLQQSGTSLVGHGHNANGTFVVEGRIVPPNSIELTKRFDLQSRKRGAHALPIFLLGKVVEQPGGNLQATGLYRTQVKSGFKQGYLNQSRWVTVSGKWAARRLSDLPRTFSSQATVEAVNKTNQADLSWNPLRLLDAQPQRDGSSSATWWSWLSVAPLYLVPLALGGAGFFIAVRIFGPGGLTSTSESARIVPTQYASEHKKRIKEFGKRLEPGGIPLGVRVDSPCWAFWAPRQMSIPARVRTANPHMLVVGTPDSGKTRMIASMVAHDVKTSDQAIIIVDTKGDLADLVIDWAEKEGLRDRLVVLDPNSASGTLAFNPLELIKDDLLGTASSVVRAFASYTDRSPQGKDKNQQSQSKEWTAKSSEIVRNAALLLAINGRTLVDLPNLLVNNDFRDLMLEKVELQRESVVEFEALFQSWSQYRKLARTEQWMDWIEPILNKIGPMLSDDRLRPLISKPVSDLRFDEVIREKKVLVVRLPRHELGDHGLLFGSLVLAGLHRTCRSKGNEKRNPVALYLDEIDKILDKDLFEHFCGEANSQIAVVCCVKSLQQLPEDLRNQLFVRLGTVAVFSVLRKDAEILGTSMFRVDGRRIRHRKLDTFTQSLNLPKDIHLYVSDEEKLNIDRICGQDQRHFFCYQMGSIATVFQLKTHDFEI